MCVSGSQLSLMAKPALLSCCDCEYAALLSSHLCSSAGTRLRCSRKKRWGRAELSSASADAAELSRGCAPQPLCSAASASVLPPTILHLPSRMLPPVILHPPSSIRHPPSAILPTLTPLPPFISASPCSATASLCPALPCPARSTAMHCPALPCPTLLHSAPPLQHSVTRHVQCSQRLADDVWLSDPPAPTSTSHSPPLPSHPLLHPCLTLPGRAVCGACGCYCPPPLS